MEEALMRELRGVVYTVKRTGPRTEPCGTLQVRGDEGELWRDSYSRCAG